MLSRRILQIALAASSLGAVCRADTVFLTDGSEINGTIVEENNNTVAVKRANGSIQSFRRGDVDTIVYDKKKKDEEKEAPVAAKPSAETSKAEVKPALKPVPADTAKPEVKPEIKNEPATAEASKTEPAKTDEKKTADAPGDTKKEEGKKGETAEKTEKPDKDKKEEWTAPPGLQGFPKDAKRMPKDKEEKFMAALERLATVDPNARAAAKNEIAGLGPEALPYVVAGTQHTNVEARSACMTLVGQFNGRTAVKQVIEVFYSAMPDNDAAPTWQVPFIRAIKETLPAISGQTFIMVQPDKALVADGLKKYITWYEDNFDRLPPQLGEPKLDPTDPDYTKKLKEARKLKLEKKDWPRPPMPADLVSGKSPPASQSERPADKAFKDTVKTVKREDVGKR